MDMGNVKKTDKKENINSISTTTFLSERDKVYISELNEDKMKFSNTDLKRATVDENNQIIDVFAKRSTKDAHAGVSNVLVTEITKDLADNRNIYINEPYKKNNREFRNKHNYRQLLINKDGYMNSAHSFQCNHLDTRYEYTPCSRDVQNISPQNYAGNNCDFEIKNHGSRVIFNDVNVGSSGLNLTNDTYFRSMVNEKKYAEKMTYCRPVMNFYNQEFIYKTMERNSRLQRLVQKLIIARQKEKQDEMWNNYINELKNKHGYNCNDPLYRGRRNVTEERTNPEFIDDFYNTRFTWQQSNPCRNLLQDFYGHDSMEPHVQYYGPTREYGNTRPPPGNPDSCLYENDPYCYPTSSQGRLMMLNRDRERDRYRFNHYQDSPVPKNIYGSRVVIVDRENKNKSSDTSRQNIKRSKCNVFESKKKINNIISTYTQTSITMLSNQELIKKDDIDEKRETLKEKYNIVSDKVNKLKKKIVESERKVKNDSFVNIETKLDTLIKSINKFMVQVKSQKNLKQYNKSRGITCELNKPLNKLLISKSASSGFPKSEKVVCGRVTGTVGSVLTIPEAGPSGWRRGNEDVSIDNILLEETTRSNIIERDIEELINRNNRPCAVQITFDIPTKECSTEVTDSLSKQRLNEKKNIVIKEIKKIADQRVTSPGMLSPRDGRMTIAVNTDPLGLLALLRVSTETIKQILSYVPNIDSYLSMIQFPQLTRNGVSHYVCNICGAAFGRPSQLSDHIQDHNLGNARNCCVCRHILDMQRRRPVGIYSCQYCGQNFTRAYCCELHQQSCARRLGIKHDVPSSLMILR